MLHACRILVAYTAAQACKGAMTANEPAGPLLHHVPAGGLTLSRSIGDFNIGQAVLPLPHIKQVGCMLWRSSLAVQFGRTVCLVMKEHVRQRMLCLLHCATLHSYLLIVLSLPSCSPPACRRSCCPAPAADWCWPPTACGARQPAVH